MKTFRLGEDGPAVSRMGFGCMGMSEFYGAHDDSESLGVLHAAADAGVTFFDTADTYGLGHNEELLGRFVRQRREKIVIATKFGIVRSADAGYKRAIDSSPAYAIRACEASLRRMGVDRIDLYYAHRLDPDVPVEDTVGAMAELVRQGKVGAIGLCEVSPEILRRAHAVHPVAAVQSEYSLWTRDPEIAVLPACRELGTSFVAYSPLGRGFLTGAISAATAFAQEDFRAHAPRFQGENLKANLRGLDRLSGLAEERRCTPAQLALAWLLAKGGDVVPIPGTRKIARLVENVAALGVSLSAEDTHLIESCFPPESVAGDRYTAEGMKGIST